MQRTDIKNTASIKEVIEVTTIKEIKERLRTIEEPNSWMQELETDERVGVKQALIQWQRQYNRRALKKEAYFMKLAFDKSFQPFEDAHIAGVDEAGRGPLAGPVVTAAVILPEDTPELVGLDDSKTISKETREQFATKIKNIAIAYAVHIQSAIAIDELNIYSATRNSMEKAVNKLAVQPDFVIVDAMQLDIAYATKSIVKADAKSLAVAAASILAKTTRDALMNALHEDYPVYNFKKNAGYGTAEHLAALEVYGPCEHHRKSFEPIKSIIARSERS